jgi:hypothetical protein
MVNLFSRLALVGLFVSSAGAVYAQPSVDVTRVKANVDTKIFSDGKTSVSDYLVSVIKSQTTCCGSDDIYVEVKVNEQGFVSSARALSGKNECMKRSIADALKYVRWDVEGKQVNKPIYFPVKLNTACTGKNDNVYAEIPKPAGWNFGQNNTPGTNPNPGVGTPGTTLNEPAGDVAINDPAIQAKVLPAKLPDPKFKKGIDNKPDPSHNKSHLNTSGPTLMKPTYAGTSSDLFIYVKSNLRKGGICGLAHVLAELTVDGNGEVKFVRMLQVNSDAVHAAAVPVLAKMKFNAMNTRYDHPFLLEIKTDIDCPNRQQINLEQVGNYFNSPSRGMRY